MAVEPLISDPTERRSGLTPLELVVGLVMVVMLLALVLPAMGRAREQSRRLECAGNQRRLGEAWQAYLVDHEETFPYVPVQPAWRYGGARFSLPDDVPFLDPQRPLNEYLPFGEAGARLFESPSDRGIGGETAGVGTAGRTAFRAFGTSYRANDRLLDARRQGLADEDRGARVAELWAAPSRVVVMGVPIWFEIYEQTGRDADWNGDGNRGNLLFLDGSVKYMTILPRSRVGPAVFDPVDPARRWLQPPQLEMPPDGANVPDDRADHAP